MRRRTIRTWSCCRSSTTNADPAEAATKMAPALCPPTPRPMRSGSSRGRPVGGPEVAGAGGQEAGRHLRPRCRRHSRDALQRSRTVGCRRRSRSASSTPLRSPRELALKKLNGAGPDADEELGRRSRAGGQGGPALRRVPGVGLPDDRLVDEPLVRPVLRQVCRGEAAPADRRQQVRRPGVKTWSNEAAGAVAAPSVEPRPSAPSAGDEPALKVTGAWKLFGHVTALRDVSLEAYAGEIVAIVGDNGAGQVDTGEAMSGVYRLTRGHIAVDGQEVVKADPRMMGRLGLSTVFQDLALVETLDVATNMYLGQPLLRWGIVQRKADMWNGAADTLRDLGVRLPSVRIPIGELSGGQRQSVAIARAVLANNPILLLDEPTAALGVRETAQVGQRPSAAARAREGHHHRQPRPRVRLP